MAPDTPTPRDELCRCVPCTLRRALNSGGDFDAQLERLQAALRRDRPAGSVRADAGEDAPLRPELVNPRLVVTKDGEVVYDGPPPSAWPSGWLGMAVPVQEGECFDTPMISMPEAEYAQLVRERDEAKAGHLAALSGRSSDAAAWRVTLGERDGLRLALTGAERELASAESRVAVLKFATQREIVARVRAEARVSELDAANGIMQRALDRVPLPEADVAALAEIAAGRWRCLRAIDEILNVWGRGDMKKRAALLDIMDVMRRPEATRVHLTHGDDSHA